MDTKFSFTSPPISWAPTCPHRGQEGLFPFLAHGDGCPFVTRCVWADDPRWIQRHQEADALSSHMVLALASPCRWRHEPTPGAHILWPRGPGGFFAPFFFLFFPLFIYFILFIYFQTALLGALPMNIYQGERSATSSESWEGAHKNAVMNGKNSPSIPSCKWEEKNHFEILTWMGFFCCFSLPFPNSAHIHLGSCTLPI